MAFTPLGMACWALVALAAIVHQWQEDAWPWWLLGAAGILAGLVWELRQVARWQLRTTIEARPLRLGRAERLAIAFTNADPRPLQIAFAAASPPQLRTARHARHAVVPANDSHRTSIDTRAVALGRAEWQRLPLRAKGPLGLAWWPKPQHLAAVFDVVPDTLGPRPVPPSLGAAGLRANARGPGRELEHLRSYLPGDPRHSVDWKATARRGALVTRVLRQEQGLTLMLVVDAGRTSRAPFDGMSQLGHYVNVCARLAEHAAANGDRVGLLTVTDVPGAPLPPARGMPAVARLRRALATLAPVAAETDLVAAAAAVRRTLAQRALVLLLTDLSGQANSRALLRCVRLLQPTHLPLVAGLIAEEVQALAHTPARDWLDPYLGLAAHHYQQNLASAAAALRRLGAYPLATTPAKLETEVFRHYRLLKRQRRV